MSFQKSCRLNCFIYGLTASLWILRVWVEGLRSRVLGGFRLKGSGFFFWGGGGGVRV